LFQGRARRAVLLLTVMFVLTSSALALFALAPAGASDNLSCPSGSTEFKVATNPLNGLSNGQSADFTINGQTFTITKVAGPDPFEDDTFNFTSTAAVVEVLVKGGVDTNVYAFNPAATSGNGLHPPLTSGGQAPVISHVSFCVADGAVTTTTTAPATTTSSSTSTSTSTSSTSTSSSSTSTSTTQPVTTTSIPPTSTSTSTSTSTTTFIPTTTTEQPTTTSIAAEGSTTTEAPTSTTTTEPSTTTSLQVEGNTSTTIFGTTTTSLGTEGSTVAPTTTTVAASGSTLPFTGGETFPLLWFGITAVAGGAMLVRRRVRA
jgi:hypothetical protein